MRFRRVLAALVLLVLPLFCPGQVSAQPASDEVPGLSGLSARWSAFTNANRGISVYDIMDNLGVLDFTGMSGERVVVLWDGTPTILVDGEVLENLDVVYGRQDIKVTCLLSGPSEQLLRMVFRLNNRGELVLETSDGDGYNGAQFVFNGNGGLITMAHCRCVRNVLTPAAVPCTVAQCNDPGTTCGAATFYCKWMGAPPLAKRGG